MSVLLATLCLNEMEHLPRLYAQHRGWPGLTKWVFVEAADRVYAETSPELVSGEGLSVDGTTEYLAGLAVADPRVIHVRHGFTGHDNPAQGKCAARNRYLDVAEEARPNFIVVVDADEYYPSSSQERIEAIVSRADGYGGFFFKQRHIWHPPSIADDPLFSWEVVKGYWQVPHCRVWRWVKGMRYNNNHNTPDGPPIGSFLPSLGRNKARYDLQRQASALPVCIHLGFASCLKNRIAKHRYYAARGEGRVDKRLWYVQCRAAFETWKRGDSLPHGAQVIPYDGPIPEVFRDPIQ